MRQNRLGPVPITNKKNVERNFERGQRETVYSGDLCITVWRDNKAVFMASNSYDELPLGKTRRWSRVEKRNVELEVPNNVAMYNGGMGGVDLMDAMVGIYRGRIRCNKGIFNYDVTYFIVYWSLMVTFDPNGHIILDIICEWPLISGGSLSGRGVCPSQRSRLGGSTGPAETPPSPTSASCASSSWRLSPDMAPKGCGPGTWLLELGPRPGTA